MSYIDLRAIEARANAATITSLGDSSELIKADIPELIARVRELESSQVGLATDVVLAEHSAANERNAADRWRAHAKVEYDLRGWLRLCEDNPAGHTEFYQWACHLYLGQPAPGDEDDEDEAL